MAEHSKSIPRLSKSHPRRHTTETDALHDDIIVHFETDKAFSDTDSTVSGEGESIFIQYDLRLLRQNIDLLRTKMRTSGRLLFDISAYYPTWAWVFGKPWIGFYQKEAFLFFFCFALTIHFESLTFGLSFKFIQKKLPYEFSYDQIAMEGVAIFLTFLLLFRRRKKSYLYVYFWVLFKGFYWSNTLYAIASQHTPFWRLIEGPLKLILDIYVTIALMMQSLIDYTRVAFTHTIFHGILVDEIKIAKNLADSDSDSDKADGGGHLKVKSHTALADIP